MAEKSFAIRTEPHRADIGGTVLLLQPEVVGAEFTDAYAEVRKVQSLVRSVEGGGKASSTKHKSEVDPEALRKISDAMREFVRGFLLEESRPVFDGMRLPDRVLVELMQWVAELYGGGSGNGDAAGGTSTG